MKKLKKIIILTFIICLLSTSLIVNITASESIKIYAVKINEEEASFDGYLLFQPEFSKNTYLINKERQVVHKWRSKYAQSLASYLLENGSIIRSCYGGIYSLSWGGGFTGRIEMIDWDSNLIWEFEYVNLTHCLHNDIEPLPNGNILMIVWERKIKDETIAAGCNPDLIPIGGFQTDCIIEAFIT